MRKAMGSRLSGSGKVGLRGRNPGIFEEGPLGTGNRAWLAALIAMGYHGYKTVSKHKKNLGKLGKVAKFGYNWYRNMRNRWNGRNFYNKDEFEGDDTDIRHFRRDREAIRKEEQLARMLGVRNEKALWAPKKTGGGRFPEIPARDYGRGTYLSNKYLQSAWEKVMGGYDINYYGENVQEEMQQYRYNMEQQGIDITEPDRHDRPKFDVNADPGINRGSLSGTRIGLLGRYHSNKPKEDL